jgi:hypothetical protein
MERVAGPAGGLSGTTPAGEGNAGGTEGSTRVWTAGNAGRRGCGGRRRACRSALTPERAARMGTGVGLKADLRDASSCLLHLRLPESSIRRMGQAKRTHAERPVGRQETIGRAICGSPSAQAEMGALRFTHPAVQVGLQRDHPLLPLASCLLPLASCLLPLASCLLYLRLPRS